MPPIVGLDLSRREVEYYVWPKNFPSYVCSNCATHFRVGQLVIYRYGVYFCTRECAETFRHDPISQDGSDTKKEIGMLPAAGTIIPNEDATELEFHISDTTTRGYNCIMCPTLLAEGTLVVRMYTFYYCSVECADKSREKIHTTLKQRNLTHTHCAHGYSFSNEALVEACANPKCQVGKISDDQ